MVTFLLFPTQVYLAYLVDRGQLPFIGRLLSCAGKSRISSSSTVEQAADNSGNEEELTAVTARTTLRSTISGSQSSSGKEDEYFSAILN